MGQLGEKLLQAPFRLPAENRFSSALLPGKSRQRGSRRSCVAPSLSRTAVGRTRQKSVTAARQGRKRSAQPHSANHPCRWTALPLGLTTAAAQQPRRAGLFCSAERRVARWSGRGRAERSGGVKLIALIPLHVYHLDPGNYHAECLNPISRQMPRGWKQMGEEQRDGDGMSWVSLGKIPGAQLRGRQGLLTGECLKAQPHSAAVRHRQENLILGDSFSRAGQTLTVPQLRIPT